MISTRSLELVIDTVVCLTLAKWETVSGQFEGYLIGIAEITFHGLRHSHASMLVSEGVDIVTISKRLGHARPAVTLAIYAHMFTSDDSKAAAAVNAALNR